ncbi:hypothetical protein [Chroococcidiopsis sp. TS-821]|nr:hypothetical protein [Chroococcidiopsis sp. TS-821]
MEIDNFLRNIPGFPQGRSKDDDRDDDNDDDRHYKYRDRDD